MCKMFRNIFDCIMLIYQYAVEFIFALYWESKKKSIPDLDKKHAILAESACSLARKIRQKELKSEDLVRACIERIKEVNPYINAVVQDRFEEALADARDVDTLISGGLSDEEFDKKPFLGVPFTTKETQPLKGMPLTLGIWLRRNERASEDCEAAARLRAAGAIPVACTNIPELLIWCDTYNSVHGVTSNPHHTGRTAGGSSGAEAGLVASYCSPISLSSDIGGSTRIPGCFCGVFGHHTTPGHTNLRGIYLLKGDEAPGMFSLGFLSKHVEDIAPLTKIIAGDKAQLLNLDRQFDIKDIKFFYLESASDLKVGPLRSEVKDVMQRVIKKISEEVPTANAPQVYVHEGFSHMYDLWRYWVCKEISNYDILYTNGNGKPNAVVELFKKIFCMSKRSFFTILRILEMQVLPQIKAEWAEKLTREFQQDLFSKLGDNGVLLLPCYPSAAPYLYSQILLTYNMSYFAVVNQLLAPATQVPIGVNSDGMPLGIQVVAAPRNDALCLSVAKYLEREFGGAVMAAKLK